MIDLIVVFKDNELMTKKKITPVTLEVQDGTLGVSSPTIGGGNG